jgi:clan AA aspartic protease
MVHTEITLINVDDGIKAQIGVIKSEEIRTVTVTALVDTGTMKPVISEELRQKLGLEIKEEKNASFANGQRVPCKVAGAVEIKWKNRSTLIQPLVLPDAKQVLLGVIALEDMDLMVNPVTQELVGVHGDEALTYVL